MLERNHSAHDLNDSRPLRWLLRLLALTVVGGNILAASNPLTGRWIIVVALGAGLICTLIYCLHLLLRRFQISLGEWLALLILQTAAMVGISQSFAWLHGSGSVASSASPLNMLVLAIALICVLLRASVVAAWSIHWLPSWSRTETAVKRSGVILSEQILRPKPWVWGLYWLGPLLWWLFAMLLIYFWANPDAVRRTAGVLFLLLLLLAANVVLSVWAWLRAWHDWQDSRRAKIRFTGSSALAFLTGRGLPAAGFLCFYALFFAATRVQQDTRAAMTRENEQAVAAELKALEAPPVPDSENALIDYKQAWGALPAIDDRDIFEGQWFTPAATLILRQYEPVLAALRRGAQKPNVQRVDDLQKFSSWGTILDAGRLLSLHTHCAARDGNWPQVLNNTRAQLRYARDLFAQHEMIAFNIGTNREEEACETLIEALIMGAADDATLTQAQELLQEHSRLRGAPLAPAAKIERLKRLKAYDSIVTHVSGWPGAADFVALMIAQPSFQAFMREFVSAQPTLLELKAGSQFTLPPPDVLEVLRADRKLTPKQDAEASSTRQAWWNAYGASLPTLLRSAIGVIRYQRHFKRWPRQLEDCVPDQIGTMPRDPFKPDDYLKFDSSPPRLFSAGPDRLKSEGAHVRDTPRSAFTTVKEPYQGDIVVWLEPPEPAAPFAPFPDKDALDEALKKLSVEIMDLRDKDEDVVVLSLKNIGRLGTRAKSAIQYVRPLVKSPSLRVKLWAIFVLGFIARDSIEQQTELKEAANDSDPDIRRFAREALQKIPKQR